MSHIRYFLLTFLVLIVTSCSAPKEKKANGNFALQDSQSVKSVKKIESDKKADTDSWKDHYVEKITTRGFFPKLANDQILLYSSNNFKGLWKYSLTNEITEQITDASGAGYQFMVKGDTVIYQVKSPRKKIEFALISEPEVKRQIDSRLSPRHLLLQQFKSKLPYAILAQDLQSIEIVTEEKRYELAPKGIKNYLNPSISPDGEKLLFEVSGGSAHIADLEGNIITSMDKVDAPNWVSNSEILYTYRKDDGMQTTSSQIFIYDIETDESFSLTDFKKLENPSINESGDMIVANTAEGEIYLIRKKK